MSKKTEAPKVHVKQNALRVLEITALKVDPSYQRGITAGVKKIVEEYDPVALGIPLVAQREDGSLWIVDGQQRIEAIKRKGNQKWIRCEVFSSTGPEYEALIFKRVNKNRTQLKPLQLYHAMLTAGDEHCWTLKKIAEEFGFTIQKTSGSETSAEIRDKKLACVNQLSKTLVRLKEDGLRWVLGVIKEVWPGDPNRVKAEIVGGLTEFYRRRKGEVDTERLLPRLMSSTPAKVLYSAGMGVSNADGNVADIIEKLYRKRSAKSAN